MTPTPNTPLTAEDVTLVRDHWSALADSDWHLIPSEVRDDLESRLVAAGLAEWRSVTEDDLDQPFAADKGIEKGGSCLDLTALGRLAYKSDPDGWIAAPEGGWTENPVPGKVVEMRFRHGQETETGPSDQFGWPHDRVPGDIIAFRLASLSPAASEPGGESGAVLAEINELRVLLDSLRAEDDGYCVQGDDDLPLRVLRRLFTALSSSPPAQAGAVAWQIRDRVEGWQDFEPQNEAQKDPAVWAKHGWEVRALGVIDAHPSGLAGAVEVARKALERIRTGREKSQEDGSTIMVDLDGGDVDALIDEALAALAPTAGEGV